MFDLTPQTFIATARALTGFNVTGRNLGWDAPAPKDPDDESHHSWDAQFVQACGYWAHYDHHTKDSAWPIPGGLTTPELAAFGQYRDVIHEDPQPGDIFLLWNPARKFFIHCGVVIDVLRVHLEGERVAFFDVYTVEGDTDEAGHVYGDRAMRVRRRLSPKMGDRFLRWIDLEPARPVRIP